MSTDIEQYGRVSHSDASDDGSEHYEEPERPEFAPDKTEQEDEEDGDVEGRKASSKMRTIGDMWKKSMNTFFNPSTSPVGGGEPTVREMFKNTFFNYFSPLLVAIPIAWALRFAVPDEHVLIFVFCFFGIIPLAQMLAFATDELSERVGQTLAGLINATLGNAVELIITIIALLKCELRVVQSSLIGSMLSNALLVLGLCFVAGGAKYSEQGFATAAIDQNINTLFASVIIFLIAAAYSLLSPVTGAEQLDVLKISRLTAVVALGCYFMYLVFQLYTHSHLFDEKLGVDSTLYKEGTHPITLLTRPVSLVKRLLARKPLETKVEEDPLETESLVPDEALGSEEEEETHKLTLWGSIILLVVATVHIAITANFLVGSIDGVAATGKISKEFIGVILLPIVGNAAEHVTAVTVAVKDKLTLSTSVAIGSCIQISFFVIPFAILFGWMTDRPLGYLFDTFESVVLFLSILLVFLVVKDGRSNYLEGGLLLALYTILAITFFYYPGTELTGLLTC